MALLIAAALFAVVAAHVALTQNQFELQRLQGQVASQQALRAQLQLQAAQQRSPSRIVSTAEQRLGMVQPNQVTYVVAVPATAPAGGHPGR